MVEDAIRFTHCALPKGSSNQIEHLRANIDMRGLPENTYPQVLTCAIAAKLIELYQPQGLLRIDLFAGIGQYYGGGNCGVHAMMAMNYLVGHASAGTKIPYCALASNKMSIIRPGHEFLVLESPGAQAVVCDPFPANHPQAILSKHYFIPCQAFRVCSDIKIVEQGRNLMMEYFSMLEQHYPNYGRLFLSPDDLSRKELDGIREYVYNNRDDTLLSNIHCCAQGKAHDYYTTVNKGEVNVLSKYREKLSQQMMAIEDSVVTASKSSSNHCALF